MLLPALLALHLSPAQAAAPPPAGHAARHSPHALHHDTLVGLKLMQMGAWHAGPHAAGKPAQRYVGVAPMFERVVAPGRLEIELTVPALKGPDKWVLPVELVFKKPFDLHDRLTLYVGLGPALDIELDERGAAVYPAVSSATGAYLWFGEHVGVDIELDYNLVIEEAPLMELCVAAGPVIHF